MKELKEKILKDGKMIGEDILKVDSFLNHQIDVDLLNEMGREFAERFRDRQVEKILTIEASGIAVAVIAAQYFNVPVVFAKKAASNLSDNTYCEEVFSYTKNRTSTICVDKKYIAPGESILIIDDFLANGNAVLGLAGIVRQAGGELAGIGIVIEKGFQPGRKKIMDELGIVPESLAVISSISAEGPVFAGLEYNKNI